MPDRSNQTNSTVKLFALKRPRAICFLPIVNHHDDTCERTINLQIFMQNPGQKNTIKGNRMNFLFLHGLAGSPNDWSATGKYLELRGHAWYAPRIPYFEAEYSSIGNLTANVRTTIPGLFLDEQSIIAGNSLGGSVALHLGEKSNLIALVACHVSFSTRWIGRGVETLNREIERVFYDTSNLTKEMRKQYEEQWAALTQNRRSFSKLKEIKSAITNNNLDALYEQMQSKIHAICGTEDKLSPLENYIALKSRFPGITINKIPECGHAIPIEKPIELAKLLIKKVREL